MTVHDINDALIASATLAGMAKRVGITFAQAEAMAAMFADLPIRTTVMVCTTAQLKRIRQSEHEARKARKR